MAAPVSDLPAPDSPTTPRTSPGAIENEMSDTATSVPWRVGNSTRRRSTQSSGSALTVVDVSGESTSDASPAHHFAGTVTVQPAIGSTKSTTGVQLGEIVFSNCALR